MSEFSMNIVTRDGAALIAQATAANPIVIVSGVSREDAATDASDLADKTAAWYTGKGGRVAAVSAAGGVARIVIAWGQEGVAQSAKSLAVLARLESQSVSQSVVLCAMSDPGSTVVLPGADDTAQAVEVPFNIAIDPTADIQVTPGSAASLSDLDRFVSCHAPGKPTGPENQTIWGWKVFRTRLSAADARIENGRVSGTLDFGGKPDNPAIARTKISRSESDALELTNGGYSVSLTSSGAVALGADTSIQYDDHNENSAAGLPVSVSSALGALTIKRADDSTLVFNPSLNLAASHMDNTTVVVPIGALVYGIFGNIDSEWDQVITSVGGSLEVPANRVTLAEYFITATTEGWRTATVKSSSAYVLLYLPAGRYRPLCQIDLTTASTHLNSYPVLLMRIS